MIKPITTPPRKRELDIEELLIELSGVSALIEALSIPFIDGTRRPSDNLIGDSLHTLHRYIERIADDISEFTVCE